jgi:hypothetical protein
VTELLLRPMADAFLQVGVFVAAFAAVAALVRWRYGRTLTATLARHPRRGVLVGALLGVSPGCGGANLTGAMFCRGVGVVRIGGRSPHRHHGRRLLSGDGRRPDALLLVRPVLTARTPAGNGAVKVGV